MEINRNNVSEIVNNAGLKPDKDYGQNFLLEPEIANRIVELLDLKENDYALEIGPGIGSLTHFLALKNIKTDIVDIDQRMTDFLKIFFKDKKDFNLITNDIRKHDVSNYTKILGNIPYNITTEIVVYLLKNAKKATRFVLMCQSEAFDRFNDLSGKNYGPISILIHLLGSCKKVFVVKPGSFYPVPKCNSTVFVIDLINKEKFDEYLGVYNLAKSLFLNRRKNISNNLLSLLKDKERVNFVLTKCEIVPNKRPEELPPSKYLEIYNCINCK